MRAMGRDMTRVSLKARFKFRRIWYAILATLHFILRIIDVKH